MRGLAEVARDLGDGDLRLTVWQNLLISGVPTEKVSAAKERIEALGLAIETNAIRSGLIACTGNTGCKFAASDTKRHAEEIARWCETRVTLDTGNRDLGDGDLRLTVWQNLLISGVPTGKVPAAKERIEALGLAIETNAIRSGLIACTGNTGCKFAASDTKRHARRSRAGAKRASPSTRR